MPILPPGSLVSINGTSLIIDELNYTFTTEFFDRPEFGHEKQRQAKETSGVLPIFVTKLGGGVAQLSFTCSSTTPRPVTPDDSDIDNIKKRFDITRLTMRGGPSLAAHVDTVYALYLTHKELLNLYQFRQNLFSLDLSISELTTLQGDATPFTNLTNTSVTVTGNSLEGLSITNGLLVEFTPGITIESPTQGVYKSWQCVLEQRSYLDGNA